MTAAYVLLGVTTAVVLGFAVAVIGLITLEIFRERHPDLRMPSAAMFKQKLKTGKSWTSLSREEQATQLTVQITAITSVMDEIRVAMDKQRELLTKYSIVSEDPGEQVRSLQYQLRVLEAEQAKFKADKLLEDHLNEKQLAEWRKRHYFHVKGKNLTYLIMRGGQVDTLKPSGSFCIRTTDHSQPEADIVLGLKLFIEANEQGFLDEANWSGGRHSLIKMTIDGTPDPTRKHGGAALQFNGAFLTNAYFQRYAQRLHEQANTTLTEANGDVTYDYVDATVFGDPGRTYLTGYRPDPATQTRANQQIIRDNTLTANAINEFRARWEWEET